MAWNQPNKTGRHRKMSPKAKAKLVARLKAYWKNHKRKPKTLAQRAKLSASLRAAAARRKAAGVKRKPLSAASRLKLSNALRASAAKRKAAGIKRKPLSDASRAKLSAGIKAAAARRKAAGIKVVRKSSTVKHTAHKSAYHAKRRTTQARRPRRQTRGK